MKKICIVIGYYEREAQLLRTLKSFNDSDYGNFEVIVVDDVSPTPVNLPNELNYRLLYHKIEGPKKWTNPEPAYNTGIAHALNRGADIIILQGAECLHVGDVISDAAARTGAGDYCAYACLSLDRETSETLPAINYLYLDDLARRVVNGASRDGEMAWYNHPVYRPVAYEFCAAMPAQLLKDLNGYDERLSDGWGYGDNHLLWRIKKAGYKISIPLTPFVAHQWHYSSGVAIENRAEKIEKNRQLFEELKNENVLRAKHVYTGDLI